MGGGGRGRERRCLREAASAFARRWRRGRRALQTGNNNTNYTAPPLTSHSETFIARAPELSSFVARAPPRAVGVPLPYRPAPELRVSWWATRRPFSCFAGPRSKPAAGAAANPRLHARHSCWERSAPGAVHPPARLPSLSPPSASSQQPPATSGTCSANCRRSPARIKGKTAPATTTAPRNPRSHRP